MNFGAWPWRTDQLVGAWWTLPIEFAFYLILPLVVWPLLKRGQLLSVMLGSLAITLAFRAYVVDSSQVVFVSGQLPGVLDVFVAGTIAAVVAPRLKAIASDWLIAFGLVALVGSSYLIHAFLEVFWSGHVSYLLVPTLTAYSLAGLMAGLMRDGGEQSLLRPAFDNRPARFLGDISYGIYLWHMPVIDGLYGTGWFRSPDGTLQDGVFAAVAMAVTMMLAWLSWRCLEKPCIAWAKRASRA
jgi:peptidoglycan/LPS O-acetylase OafA/YrhL